MTARKNAVQTAEIYIEIQNLIMVWLAVVNLAAGIVLVFFKQIRWKDLFYLLIVGTLVEFALELSLLASGIR